MKQSNLPIPLMLSTVGQLYEIIFTHTELSDEKTTLMQRTAQVLMADAIPFLTSNDIKDAFKPPKAEPKKTDDQPTTKDKVDAKKSESDEKQTSDPMLEQAYELLKDESKPNQTFLAKNLKVSPARAKKMLAQLVEEGRITLYVKPAKIKKPKKSLEDVIAELPDGSNTLLKPPYNLLSVLPSKKRAPYLAGLKLEDVVDADALAAAVEEGVDRGLVDQVINLTDKTRPQVKPENQVDWKKYEKHIMKWTGIVGGGDLWNLLSAAGISKGVLGHFKAIAEAIESGDV